MFRVTYYKYRINLEVFHVLTDGMGGINFLKEPDLSVSAAGTSEAARKRWEIPRAVIPPLNREDSFLKNYKHSSQKGYQTKRAYLLKEKSCRRESSASCTAT